MTTQTRRPAARLAAMVLALLVLTVPSSAQVRQLSLDEAIDIAVQHNRDIDAAQLETHKADAAISEAKGNALPSITASGGYTRNLQNQVIYFPGGDGVVRPIQMGSANALTASLQLQQVVFNAAVLTGIGTAGSYAEISREQLRSTANTTVLAVRRAYYAALLAREVVTLNERILASAEQNHAVARQYYEKGLRAEFDAIRAKVQVDNQRPAVVQARDNEQLALENLKLLLALGPDTRLELTGTLDAGAIDTAPLDVADVLRQVQENNPQLRAARLGSEVARDLVDINRAEYLPSVALFGNYSLGAQADALGDLDFQPTSMVGLNLSVNLFNGFQTTSRVEQAAIDHQKSQTQLAQLDNALRLQLESTVRRINYARERIASSAETIAQAERGYEIATVAYRAGTGTQYQINDADLARAQSRLNRLNAIYDHRTGLAELEALVGRTVALTGDGHDVIVNR